MPTPLLVTRGERPDGTPLLAVAGEIDMSNSDKLSEALVGTLGPLVLDLTAVDYLDSAGLNVLFAHVDRLELIATPLLEPVLTISGLARLTTVHSAQPDSTQPESVRADPVQD
ncbi:STAS domain-containing protein [Streptomyces fructofermentans]|uniref:Anti-anti-sigma factor n=1 Tax=Streptomyces fructofermentans TaxID=152141 RepID=A0A918U4G2_9ACTN|nr:STAS domain-containing protein [Streptomyces fructofermentans]GGX91899.1 anti-anti-sigma factor [Streptomyces fructofermentans]